MFSRQFLDVVGLLYFCSIYLDTNIDIKDDYLCYWKGFKLIL